MATFTTCACRNPRAFFLTTIALKQAITQAERDADEDARIAYYTKRDALVEQAKAKLTEEEFDAVFELGRDD
jgi:ribonuclease I